MDGDLQDPPELIPQLLARWQEGYEVVYARRARRARGAAQAGGLLRLLPVVEAAQRAAHSAGHRRLRPDGSAGLAALNELPERSRFIRGLRAFVGFRQGEVVYDRDNRHGGRSKYTLGRLMRLAADGLLGFSDAPLKLIGLPAARCARWPWSV